VREVVEVSTDEAPVRPERREQLNLSVGVANTRAGASGMSSSAQRSDVQSKTTSLGPVGVTVTSRGVGSCASRVSRPVWQWNP
jgi:hypothetical protein